MCCGSEYRQNVIFRIVGQDGALGYELTCRKENINKTYLDSLAGVLNKIKITEKINELVCSSIHLFKPILNNNFNKNTLHVISKIYSGAHELEHLLHACCFLNDLTDIARGKFLVYSDSHQKQLDLLQTSGRIIHAASHLFSSVHYLHHDLQIIPSSIITKISHYHLIISATGFAFTTLGIFLLKMKHSPKYESDLLKSNISGFVFDLLQAMPKFNGSKTLTDIAGLFHSATVLRRLCPKPEYKDLDRDKSKAITESFNLR